MLAPVRFSQPDHDQPDHDQPYHEQLPNPSVAASFCLAPDCAQLLVVSTSHAIPLLNSPISCHAMPAFKRRSGIMAVSTARRLLRLSGKGQSTKIPILRHGKPGWRAGPFLAPPSLTVISDTAPLHVSMVRR